MKEAKRHLQRWSRTDLMVGNAESIPLPDESQDAVTSIFMFHELPPKVRRIVLSEFARVLKPGGRLVLVDSLQHGDEPDYDGLLELFPQSFHEPYYLSYIKEDFAALCQDRGLTYIRNARACRQTRTYRQNCESYVSVSALAPDLRNADRGPGCVVLFTLPDGQAAPASH